MKRLRVIEFLVSLGLVAALVAGCAISPRSGSVEQLKRWREATYYWGSTTYLANNLDPPVGSPELWCKDANDKSLPREWRRMSAAFCFGAYVKPGFTVEKMRAAIPDSRWLDECKLEVFNGGTGDYPAWWDMPIFYLWLFPDDNDTIGWSISFTLSNSATGRTRSKEEAARFLRGMHPDRTLGIKEFMVVYPLPGCETGGYLEELHTRRGVGVLFRPASWFEKGDRVE